MLRIWESRVVTGVVQTLSSAVISVGESLKDKILG